MIFAVMNVFIAFIIDHFTAACLVAWPLNESEAGGDIVLIETSLQIIFFCKPVLCQARDKVLPDIQSIWSDKKIFPHLL